MRARRRTYVGGRVAQNGGYDSRGHRYAVAHSDSARAEGFRRKSVVRGADNHICARGVHSDYQAHTRRGGFHGEVRHTYSRNRQTAQNALYGDFRSLSFHAVRYGYTAPGRHIYER